MKLRNKKTGKIINSKELLTDEFIIDLFSKDFNYFNSKINKIQEEWEDYEELKDFWYIDADGEVRESIYLTRSDKSNLRNFGNYFKTREEAERVVKKLKAWKQLQDNCNFRFNGVERDENGRLKGVKVKFDKAQVTFDTAKRCYEILDLLFGGEE